MTVCAGLVFGSLPVGAQVLAPGKIVVTVVDAFSGTPIADAAVFLLGADIPTSALTDDKGLFTFDEIDPGSYSVEVKKDGYLDSAVVPVEVGENQRVAVDVRLQTQFKTIAVVTAKAGVSVSSTDIDADSAQRKISMSLQDALGKIAGVSVDDTTYGPDSGFSISLLNHDPSQTGYSIDGIRISGPASSILGGASNLFTGASVSFTPTAGHIAGNIDYRILRPSKYWTYNLANTVGSFGASTQTATVTGTTGHLALALQYDQTRGDTPLSGLVYEDQSGQAYAHQATNSGVAELVNANYTVDPKMSLGGYVLHSTGRNSSVCSNFTTVLPCGLGPSDPRANQATYGSFNANSQIGNVSLMSYVGFSLGHSGYNDPGRSLAGVVDPYSSSSGYHGLNFGVSASVTARRHTDNLSMNSSGFGGSSSSTFDGVTRTFVLPAQRTSEINLSDKISASARLQITHSLSEASATGSGQSLILTEKADWKLGENDTLEGSISAGSASPTYTLSQTVGDALSADYDCYNRSVFLSGPNDSSTRQSSVSYNVTALHKFRAGSVTVQLYRQNAFGQYFSAAVPLAAEPDSVFPGGLPAYLASLQAVWSSPNICGSIPFSTDRLYVDQGITSLSQVNSGATMNARVPLGTNVMALPTFAWGNTYLSSLDPRMAYPGSFYAVGRQLPRRPLVVAGLTIDGVLAHAKAEWLLNAQFTGINNGLNQPPFTIYTAGFVLGLHRGTLTVLESNIFGTDSGLFTTYRGVNPMPVAGGGTFAYSTIPAPPRQWIVTWRIPWSQHISTPKQALKPR